VTSQLIDALRWAILIVGALLSARAARGFIAFGLGDQWIGSYFRSLVFLMGLRCVSVQSSYLLEGVPEPGAVPRVVVTLLLEVIVLAYAHWGLGWLARHPMRKMRPVFDHAAEAMAITELAQIDPEAAERLAAEALQLTVEHVVRHTERGRPSVS
jgi:hypothetical protein